MLQDISNIPDIPEGYLIDKEGVWIEPNKGKGEPKKISGPVWVSAHTCSPDGSDGWGMMINWVDRNQQLREQATTYSQLHDSGLGLAKDLAAQGLAITPGKERYLCNYLGNFNSKERVYSVSKLGWVENIENNSEKDIYLSYIYILPHTTISQNMNSCKENKRYVFQPEKYSPSMESLTQEGSLEEWQFNIAKCCRGNPVLIAAMCASLAGPLLKFVNMDSIGIHFYGRSSYGKTTLAQVAASIWGCGADPADVPSQSYIKRWNTTANAIEGLAAAHNDGVLILDELGTCLAKDFGALVYNLTGGQGKSALDANRNLKMQRNWRSVIISTGEISSQQKIEEDGRVIKAGQLLRMLDITADKIISDFHGEDASIFVDKLKLNCSKYYGHAGPYYIQGILNNKSFCNKEFLLRKVNEATDKLITDNIGPEQKRVLKKFGLFWVAGIVAHKLGLFTNKETNEEHLTLNDIEDAIKHICNLWLESGAGISDVSRGVKALRDFIIRNEARLRDVNDYENNVANKIGYIDRSRGYYLLTSDGLKEACKGYNYKEIAKELDKLDLIHKNDGKRLKSKHTIKEGYNNSSRIHLYAIKKSISEL